VVAQRVGSQDGVVKLAAANDNHVRVFELISRL
jgi:hypothetical protein